MNSRPSCCSTSEKVPEVLDPDFNTRALARTRCYSCCARWFLKGALCATALRAELQHQKPKKFRRYRGFSSFAEFFCAAFVFVADSNFAGLISFSLSLNLSSCLFCGDRRFENLRLRTILSFGLRFHGLRFGMITRLALTV